MSEAEEIGGYGFDVHLEKPYLSKAIRSGDMIHFHIPEQTSHTYIGCEDLLGTLRSAFFPGNCTVEHAGPKSFVVFGMGGSGKTELCSKFATDNKHELVLSAANGSRLMVADKTCLGTLPSSLSAQHLPTPLENPTAAPHSWQVCSQRRARADTFSPRKRSPGSSSSTTQMTVL